ncbi:MAG: YidH family protein [Isosphaeraceae bacterium]
MATDEPSFKSEPFDAQTRMAAHRTFLAYIRTGLGTMSLGFVIARFNVFLWKTEYGKGLPPSSPWLPLWLGMTLTVFGVAINIVATVHHFQLMRSASRGEPYRPERWSPDLIVGAGMVFLGLAIVVDLFLAR